MARHLQAALVVRCRRTTSPQVARWEIVDSFGFTRWRSGGRTVVDYFRK